eukprot:GHVN01069630.1.p1 GENE.GHVN01069630.1~~GHVN01069630.1.p1  ORF type:complete len:106 (-),score=12.30 GHVN01069630.1:667-984(-)
MSKEVTHQKGVWWGNSLVSHKYIQLGVCLELWVGAVRADMAGYGFGLLLSRAFARCFGGDSNIQSHFGVGTDVFVTLNHIGDQKEALFFEERADLRATHVQRAKP